MLKKYKGICKWKILKLFEDKTKKRENKNKDHKDKKKKSKKLKENKRLKNKKSQKTNPRDKLEEGETETVNNDIDLDYLYLAY